MTVEVKICGLSTPDTMRTALDAGADYVGLVFFPKSPRNVSLEIATSLADIARGRAGIVALMVDPDDSLVAAVASSVHPDIVQLHGAETPERCAAIRSAYGCRIMKVVKVETAEDAAAALAYRGVADLILFDAKAPKGAALPGGNGVPFDWTALDAVKAHVDWMLSGGLTPENVANAIRLTGAGRVDVSSGIERAPGVKDPALIRAFIAAAKGAIEGD
ncbi:MAG: phosphoribosylanthranilate isomerase [Hyphomicrobiaceae bacterium]